MNIKQDGAVTAGITTIGSERGIDAYRLTLRLAIWRIQNNIHG
jgi:hypothetical protein